jgi:hypothetical protein
MKVLALVLFCLGIPQFSAALEPSVTGQSRTVVSERAVFRASLSGSEFELQIRSKGATGRSVKLSSAEAKGTLVAYNSSHSGLTPIPATRLSACMSDLAGNGAVSEDQLAKINQIAAELDRGSDTQAAELIGLCRQL